MGSDGLLHPGKSAEMLITVPSLDRAMKLRLSWHAYEDKDDAARSHVSHVRVPRTAEEAAAGWSGIP